MQYTMLQYQADFDWLRQTQGTHSPAFVIYVCINIHSHERWGVDTSTMANADKRARCDGVLGPQTSAEDSQLKPRACMLLATSAADFASLA